MKHYSRIVFAAAILAAPLQSIADVVNSSASVQAVFSVNTGGFKLTWPEKCHSLAKWKRGLLQSLANFAFVICP